MELGLLLFYRKFTASTSVALAGRLQAGKELALDCKKLGAAENGLALPSVDGIF